jgi:diaminopimelate decarboxylase
VTPPTTIAADLRPILPLTARVNGAGHLEIGGCDALDLAREFGTPLYVFDEEDLRQRCREFQTELTSRHADTQVIYAGKAYLGTALLRLLAEEGLGLDVVSGGELAIARAADFPMGRVYFHGNNKSAAELGEAVGAGVGRVVIDNLREVEELARIAADAGARQAVLLRVTPNVDAHTHQHITTGVIDTKFGLAVENGQAEEGVRLVLSKPSLDLRGLHCHIGSQLFDLDPLRRAIAVCLEFAAGMKKAGMRLREFSPGGGVALQYARGEVAPSVAAYAEAVTGAAAEARRRHDLPAFRLVVEPGRSLVGRAGVALYTVGARKEIPGVRIYVAVDGGMADNIRPALYEASYEALAAARPAAAPEETVTVVGKYCESGDVLIREIALPRLEPGEVLAVPASGAYNLAMASNYNASLRPPVVFVRDGSARLVRRRETYADLLAAEAE